MTPYNTWKPNRMKIFTMSMTQSLVDAVDAFVAAGFAKSRSELLRHAVIAYLNDAYNTADHVCHPLAEKIAQLGFKVAGIDPPKPEETLASMGYRLKEA